MKLFKKVLAVALVGAMAVSMLTACSSASKTTKVKNALKNVGVKQDAAMVADTEKAMAGLQKGTEAYKAAADDTAKQQVVAALSSKLTGEQAKDYTFSNNSGTGNYDLYIWTNGVSGRPTTPPSDYPYLMKVTNVHVTTRLAALLDENFVKKGAFEATNANLTILKKLLKGANVTKAGISCEKVYGYDVLLVTVPKGTTDLGSIDINSVTLD